MSIRPRHGSALERGNIFFLGRRVNVSLAAIIGALSAAGPRMVLEVESFLLPSRILAGSCADTGAAMVHRRAAAVSQIDRGREGRVLLGRERAGAGVSRRASMDDEDEEFVVVSCRLRKRKLQNPTACAPLTSVSLCLLSVASSL